MSKSLRIISAGEDLGEREPFLHCWWECKSMQSLQKSLWSFLKKLKRITTLSSSSTSRFTSRKYRNTNSKRYLHPMLMAALIIITKMWKPPKCPSTDNWPKKMRCGCGVSTCILHICTYRYCVHIEL